MDDTDWTLAHSQVRKKERKNPFGKQQRQTEKRQINKVAHTADGWMLLSTLFKFIQNGMKEKWKNCVCVCTRERGRRREIERERITNRTSLCMYFCLNMLSVRCLIVRCSVQHLVSSYYFLFWINEYAVCSKNGLRWMCMPMRGRETIMCPVQPIPKPITVSPGAV